MNVDLWVCNDDFNKKYWRQKRDFCCFSMTLNTVIFVLVQIQTLIFCKNRWYFCVYWVSKFEVLSSELWKLIVKAMFAWLRKLQFFKAVESCTGGYGRFRCQRVNKLQSLAPKCLNSSASVFSLNSTHHFSKYFEALSNKGSTSKQNLYRSCHLGWLWFASGFHYKMIWWIGPKLSSLP